MCRREQGLKQPGLPTLPPDITQLSKGLGGGVSSEWPWSSVAHIVATVTLMAKEHGSSHSGSFILLVLPFTEGSGTKT